MGDERPCAKAATTVNFCFASAPSVTYTYSYTLTYKYSYSVPTDMYPCSSETRYVSSVHISYYLGAIAVDIFCGAQDDLWPLIGPLFTGYEYIV